MKYPVQFIDIDKEDKDLILSFAIHEDSDPYGVKSLNLMRTPCYEQFLTPFEQGVRVTFEDDQDEINMLESIKVEPYLVEIKSTNASYLLDMKRVDEEEIEIMIEFLDKLNFDKKFIIKK